MLLVRAVAGLLALVGGALTVRAIDDRLLLRDVLGGVAYGYRLEEVALLAAAAAVVWLCGCAAWRATRPGWDAVLLTGPSVVAALLAEVLVPVPDDPNAYGFFQLVDPEGPPYVLVDLGLVVLALLVGLGVPTWALLRSRRRTP